MEINWVSLFAFTTSLLISLAIAIPCAPATVSDEHLVQNRTRNRVAGKR